MTDATARILIVEDDPGLAKVIRWTFSQDAFELHTASSGEEALRLFPQLSPDLVILDCGLPGLSGVDVCTEIRSSPIRARIPILMLTGEADLETRFLAEKAGVDHYMLKPFSPKGLREKALELLRS
ncbi:MAG: response regulator transcription factor [Armatimonadetes bacterium]|nr:response regulator transcription factor [Armatimonadota bacterium]